MSFIYRTKFSLRSSSYMYIINSWQLPLTCKPSIPALILIAVSTLMKPEEDRKLSKTRLDKSRQHEVYVHHFWREKINISIKCDFTANFFFSLTVWVIGDNAENIWNTC